MMFHKFYQFKYTAFLKAFAIIFVGIAVSAAVIVIPRAPITHQVNIYELPADGPLTRAVQVKNDAPPWPIARRNDYASATFWPGAPAYGSYLKISDTLSDQWEEVAFVPNPRHGSPLLLDIGRNGFQVSQLGTGVFFDLFADGENLHLQWVAEGSDDAFLVLDLNQNGEIDDGSELFGEGTALLSSIGEKATNGYDALAQYDELTNGGNADSIISEADAIWSSLQLWNDEDADAISSPDELVLLTDTTLKHIDIKYKRSPNKVDSSGNLIPYWSWVTTVDPVGPKKLKMIDIYFMILD